MTSAEDTTTADSTTDADPPGSSDDTTGIDDSCGEPSDVNTLRLAHLVPDRGPLDLCLGRPDGCLVGPLLANAGQAAVDYEQIAVVEAGVEADTTIRWVEAGAADCETPAAALNEIVADLTGDPKTLMVSAATGSEPVVLTPLPEALDPGRVYAVLIHGADAGNLMVAPDGDCSMVNPFFVAWADVQPGTIGISPNGDVPYFNSAPPIEDYAIMVCQQDQKLLTRSVTLSPGDLSTFFFFGTGSARAPYGLVECQQSMQSCSVL